MAASPADGGATGTRRTSNGTIASKKTTKADGATQPITSQKGKAPKKAVAKPASKANKGGKKAVPKNNHHAEGRDNQVTREGQELIEASKEGPIIVGVGASAGGLEALMHMLGAIPANVGVAVIIVQHLEPHHPSRLTQLLAKGSKLPVHEATEGAKIEVNNVYVIPPNADLAVEAGRLRILKRSVGQSRLAVIDKFFASLAQDLGPRSMGVVLSGTGSDGTEGLRVIKEAGGITFAQDPSSAAYQGMPEAAIRAGVIDFVMTPESIAEEVDQLRSHPYVGRAERVEAALDKDIPNLKKVYLLLRNSSGVDFADYKVSTFKRRMLRRMALRDIRHLPTYVETLRREPEEVAALYRDSLISVTSFFRESRTFDELRANVFPKLAKHDEHPIRIWVPGCSTGEEVFSMAMALVDFLGDDGGSRPIQIFATDLNEDNIVAARRGLYSESAMENVPSGYVRRFFNKTEEGYMVAKRLRDMCVFSVHNVYRDPPFSEMDLISCRNLLIYLGAEAQKRALTAFHYALRKGGVLVLGSSESTGQLHEYYEPLGGKAPIFVRKETALPLSYALFQRSSNANPVAIPKPQAVASLADTLRNRVDNALLEVYVPPGVVIDRVGEVIEFIGRTREYLEPAPGRASLNLFRMARKGLELDIRAVLMEAQKTQKRSIRRARWKYEDSQRLVAIECLPVKGQDEPDIYVVTFLEQEAARAALPPMKEGDVTAVDQLEDELEETRNQLQATVEQYETTTEELRTSNEEALSINEELQSTNEELQTTAEELQSANEELSTLNEELHNRNVELTRANSDLENLLTSVRFPIVFLGQDLAIRRFTPAAESMLRLLGSDVGRPIGDLRLPIGIENLEELVGQVIDTMRTVEREVQDDSGRWSLLRIQPYRTIDNRIDGAVLVLVDINELKKARDELERSNQDLQQFAAFASHELRAPLRNAKLHLGLVGRAIAKKDLTKSGQDLETASKNIDKMMALIQALLQFSEATSDAKEYQVLDMAEVANASAEVTGVSAKEDFELHIRRPIHKAWGDPSLLSIVLNNLFSNAARHAKGPVAVTMSSKQMGHRIEYSVHDDGPGVKGVEPEEVFDLFRRGADGDPSGVGVGLAICRRIIDAHGGSIRLARSDKGTDIRFTLDAPPKPAEG